MTAMTLLPRSRLLTYPDLEAMPEDGHRYELIDASRRVVSSERRPRLSA